MRFMTDRNPLLNYNTLLGDVGGPGNALRRPPSLVVNLSLCPLPEPRERRISRPSNDRRRMLVRNVDEPL
jgi:hypothetical protein